MTKYTVADVSYNRDGEMEQFLIFWDEGEPDTRRATTKNILLFDPEDEMPFDGGLYQFFENNNGVKVSDDPEIVVAPDGNEYSYILSIDGSVVETTPTQAESFLEALYDAVVEGNTNGLERLYESILNEQVRRRIVNAIHPTFPESERIEVLANGWLVDDFFLVDWNAKMYTKNNDRSEDDYIRNGSDAVKTDKTYEFVQFTHSIKDDFDNKSILIGDEEFTLTDRESLFLAKVTWLLDREYYHPDEAFWTYTNQWANTPTTQPNMDQFSL